MNSEKLRVRPLARRLPEDFRSASWAAATPVEALEPHHETMVDALVSAAAHDEDIGVTVLGEREKDPAVHRSYAQILEGARRVAAALSDRGVKPGDRVLIVLPTSVAFLEAFFGALILGAVAVPAYPPAGLRLFAGLERLGAIARNAGARICVTNRLIKPLLGDLGLRAPELSRLVTIEELEQTTGALDLGPLRRTATAFIQYTSGSTGTPKGVVLAHEALAANVHAIGLALEVRRTDRVVSWCPLYHDMGLIGVLLFATYWRLPLVLLSPTAFLRQPGRWLRAIHDHRGTLSPAPNFGYALAARKVTPAEREGLDLRSWRVALNGAEPVSARTLAEFNEAYAPHGFRPEAMLPVYGLAETSLAATFPKVGAAPKSDTVDRRALAEGHAVPTTSPDGLRIMSLGQAVPGHTVRVVDEHGKDVGERVVGHVVVGGPSLMREYWAAPEATRETLRNGELYTGDLGYLVSGELFVTGRAKDVLIVRGKNLYAEDLERSAERAPGARAGGVVAFGAYDEELCRDKVFLVVEARTEGDAARNELAAAVRREVLESAQVEVDEVVVVPTGTIPKTPSGKRQRSLCRSLYFSGALRPQAPGPIHRGLLAARVAVGHLVLRGRELLHRSEARSQRP